ncbi:hypothetical protein [Kitasatospora sp. GP82]|uniref:hypothetical protein n=1 Tax=Kitasatospora sp. GP82 TaxID=3035089 RepID=UPI00247552A6|nr:hypothetical protein [Kitasatospora sp. GP82]MDH6129269.1 hypothetical protein [Kitasatospora sp. GP82]
MSIPTVPDDAMFGVALAFAVDRMRDLVRRSFLARLCLVSGTTPLWPFAQSTPVDAALADDTTRTHWRTHWHDQLTALGTPQPPTPQPPAPTPSPDAALHDTQQLLLELKLQLHRIPLHLTQSAIPTTTMKTSRPPARRRQPTEDQ